MNYKVSDMMAITIARELKDAKNAFHGVASPLPMVAILLAKKLYQNKLTYLNITGGVDIEPEALEISTDGHNLFEGSKSIFGLTDIFDLAARGELDVAFLSGVQIDKYGNLNNSVIGDYHKPKVRLPGGAGSAVLIPNCKRGFIWRTKHDKKTFVENVDFITATGNVKFIFTPLCVFEKVEGELWLRKISPLSSLEEIKANTGFEIKYDKLEYIKEPSDRELRILREIDSDRIRDSEF